MNWLRECKDNKKILMLGELIEENVWLPSEIFKALRWNCFYILMLRPINVQYSNGVGKFIDKFCTIDTGTHHSISPTFELSGTSAPYRNSRYPLLDRRNRPPVNRNEEKWVRKFFFLVLVRFVHLKENQPLEKWSLAVLFEQMESSCVRIFTVFQRILRIFLSRWVLVRTDAIGGSFWRTMRYWVNEVGPSGKIST